MAQTTATVKTHLAALLRIAESDLETHWDTKITQGLNRSNRHVKDILMGERGFAASNVSDWNSLDDYVLDQALYYVLRDSPGQRGFDVERVNQFDRTKDLRRVSILDTSEVEVTTEEMVKGDALEDGAVFPADITDSGFYFED